MFAVTETGGFGKAQKGDDGGGVGEDYVYGDDMSLHSIGRLCQVSTYMYSNTGSSMIAVIWVDASSSYNVTVQ